MAGWSTGTVEANGIELHYLRTGGDKPPVVLLHGLTASGACWTPVARALEQDFDLVMPDARGHGNSAAPDGGYRYDELASDVLGLIDALGLARPVLAGHSMGGLTAAVVAARDPARVRALVLADPTFLAPERQREVHQSEVAAQHARILGRPKEELVADLSQRHRRRSPELIELLARARLQTRLRAFEVLTPPNPDYRQLIDALEVPGLLVIGDPEAGAVVSTEAAAELARRNPRLRVEQLAGAGHGLTHDLPERFAERLGAFVRSLGG